MSPSILLPMYFLFRFQSSRVPTVDVGINDKLDIICPRKGRDEGEERFYFKLFLVESSSNAEECKVMGGQRLITCDKPDKEKKYTFFFQEISPSPFGLEFTPYKSYYVICELPMHIILCFISFF